MFKSINPWTLATIAEYASDNADTLDQKLRRSARVFGSWRNVRIPDRAQMMRNVASILRTNKAEYARLITGEMGKILKESLAEIEKCAVACEFYAQYAEEFLRERMVATEANRSYVAYEPLGPVLAIMPWNFPFWQVFRFAVPTLMAGNTGLLKHAANVTGCSLAIENIFSRAGFPDGTFQSLLAGPDEVQYVISRNEIVAVTLTGSEHAGIQVGAAAGKNLKKSVLELGGSDPFIVLEDADLELAARVGTQSRMQNAGQSCIAAKRFIVVGQVRDRFLELFRGRIESLVQGDPMNESTNVGPVARLDLAEGLEKQLGAARNAGARLICGGERHNCNIVPALLDGVLPGNPAFEEEVFGPIACVTTARNEDHAVELANSGRYGLGASVWTGDRERGERVARKVESGSVFVNSLMRSDQRLPFGGIKRSGYGRELSWHGILEFTNVKTVYIS